MSFRAYLLTTDRQPFLFFLPLSLFLCLSVCLSLPSLYVSLSPSLFLFLPLCLSACLSLSSSLSLSLFLFIPISLSFSLSVHLHIYMCVHLCVCEEHAMSLGTPPLLAGKCSRDIKLDLERCSGDAFKKSIALFSEFFGVSYEKTIILSDHFRQWRDLFNLNCSWPPMLFRQSAAKLIEFEQN